MRYAIGAVLRAMIGWAPPAWIRPRPEQQGAGDMLSVISPPPVIQRQIPSLPIVDGENLAAEADRLAQEVRAASTRNRETATTTIQTAQQIKGFEERARDTLRALMDRMGEDNERRR